MKIVSTGLFYVLGRKESGPQATPLPLQKTPDPPWLALSVARACCGVPGSNLYVCRLRRGTSLILTNAFFDIVAT